MRVETDVDLAEMDVISNAIITLLKTTLARSISTSYSRIKDEQSLRLDIASQIFSSVKE